MIGIEDRVLGANAERSRNHNRQVVLGRIRAAGAVGRAEIARASGLSTQAVSNIIADLAEDGLIREDGRRAGSRGLPATQYTLNPNGGFALGIEVRTDAVFAALLNLAGRPIFTDRRRLPRVSGGGLAAVLGEIRQEAAAHATPTRILGAGIVMPGPFGDTGLAGSGSDLPAWTREEPAPRLREALDLPVIVENDANAAAMAERVAGVAEGLSSYAFLYFGTGLGLGVVHRGQLIAGAFGNAGEIGHVPVPAGGCVRPLEEVVSRLAVQRHLARAGIEAGSGAELQQLFYADNPHLLEWLDRAAEPLSAAITIVENLFDPETVILGGAMPNALLDRLIGSVTLSPRSVAERTDRPTPRVLRGASGRMTATLGAAALVINRAFTPAIAPAVGTPN
ncbi:MAG: ROK family transcriptional regulator [Pseudomonadota bacterium]